MGRIVSIVKILSERNWLKGVLSGENKTYFENV